eukprot:9699330-Ditylum_brightwellii.AAC.1
MLYMLKTCLRIHPGHELLYNDLSVKFVDAGGVTVGVKALHTNCTGKYVPTTKKVQNVLDIVSLPRITDDQVVQLGKFSCDA